jgi:predicted metal-binding membrane protein
MKDRVIVALAVGVAIVLAWAYLVRAAAAMSSMADEARMHAAMGMADMRVWGAAEWLALFIMWAVMMVAMMLPSASPVILLVLGVYRRRNEPRADVAAVMFVAGYVIAWAAFSAVAASAQLALHRAALMAADMRLASSAASGVVLVLAGIYQWLPIKNFCLTHCQSPLGFLTQHWREGAAGGLVMGVRHGLFCVGCCWLLMLVLFAVGVMNLFWVAALAVFVMLEKLVARGPILTRVAGVAIAGWGIYLLTSV